MGKAKTMQSKTMSITAWAQTTAFKLMHLPVCCPSHEVQMYVIGRQLTVIMMVNMTVLSVSAPIKLYTALRSFWRGKTRRYRKRNASLVQPTDVNQKISASQVY